MMNTFQINSKNGNFTLEYSPEDFCFKPVIDGKESQADCRELAPGIWSLILDGKSLIMHIRGEHPSYEITIENEIIELDIRNELDLLLDKMGMKDTMTQKNVIVKAAIPGLVKKIEVKEGDNVEKGQSLLILEAMKMENEIKTQVQGKITKIYVEEGQALEKNTKLMEIEKNDN